MSAGWSPASFARDPSMQMWIVFHNRAWKGKAAHKARTGELCEEQRSRPHPGGIAAAVCKS